MKLATAINAPLFISLLVFACVGTTYSQSVTRRSSRFRISVTVETDPVVNKRLRDVKEYLSKPQWRGAASLAGGWTALFGDVEQRNWTQAINLLERVSSQPGHTLVPVEPGRFINARHYCNLLLASLPDAALAAYRKRHDARARKRFDFALKTRDLPAMKRIVQTAFVRSVGDDALFAL
ncbi:MAG: hypothetical protein IID45_02835, partial [Planctomycetes bacterium]|nr:hypothetical protein [Planctomycetota bacterium]